MLDIQKEVCVICGEEVNITAGHYVNFPVAINDGETTIETEFHCLECDPILPIVEDEHLTD